MVIELGEDFRPVEMPAEVRGRRGFRTVAIVAVVVLTLLGVSAARTGPVGVLRPIADFPAYSGSTVMISGDTVLLADTHDGDHLVAYDRTTGALRWTTKLPINAVDIQLIRVGDVVVAGRFYQNSADDNVIGVDLATGRLLWHSPELLFHIGLDHIVVIPPDGEGNSVTEQKLAALDPRTGRTLWQRVIPGDCGIDIGEVLAEVCQSDSVLHLVDLSTGASRATVDLGRAEPPATIAAALDLAQAAGVVVVHVPLTSQPELIAVSAANGRRLWSRPLGENAVVHACGVVFCVVGGDVTDIDRGASDRSTIAVDPPTGAVVPTPVDPQIRDDPQPSLQVGGQGVGPDSRFAMVPEGMHPDRAGDYPEASELPLVGEDRAVKVPSSASFQTFLAGIDPGTRHMAVVARLSDVGVQSCVGIGAYLACELPNDRLRLWSLPDPPSRS